MYSKDGTATVEYNVLPSSFIAGRKRDLHPLIIKVREAEPDSLGSASQFFYLSTTGIGVRSYSSSRLPYR